LATASETVRKFLLSSRFVAKEMPGNISTSLCNKQLC
jgi:hypothetical protein